MKRIYSFIGWGALLVAFLLSCTKQLNQNPLSQFSNEAFWTSQNDATLALAAVYRGNIQATESGAEYSATDWWSYYGLLFLEFATDNAYDRRGDNSDVSELGNGKLTATNTYVSAQWANSYARIARCNWFMENVARTPMDTAVINRMYAEAQFIRACQYFYLSQYWGAAPLVTTTLSPAQANVVTLTPKAQIVSFVESQLDSAIAELPWYKNLLSSEQGRASKQAAMAFLGRIQLSSHQYAAAATTYDAIISEGDNIIDPNYTSLFDGTNNGSKEIIFATQYLPTSAPDAVDQHTFPRALGGYSIFCPLGGMAESYEFNDGTPFSYADPRYNAANIGQDRDPRLGYNILWNMQTFGSIVYKSHPDSTSALDRVSTTLQATRTGFINHKFNSTSMIGQNLLNSGIDLPIIRYSEILLSDLEAHLENGETITTPLLNKTINLVRGRTSVNMPPVTETDPSLLRVILRRERRNELAFEGIRFWDLLRWGVADSILTGPVYGAPFPGAKNLRMNGSVVDPYGRWYVTTKAFVPADTVWPVPQNEVNINPNL